MSFGDINEILNSCFPERIVDQHAIRHMKTLHPSSHGRAHGKVKSLFYRDCFLELLDHARGFQDELVALRRNFDLEVRENFALDVERELLVFSQDDPVATPAEPVLSASSASQTDGAIVCDATTMTHVIFSDDVSCQDSVPTTTCASQTFPVLEVSTVLSGDASTQTCVPSTVIFFVDVSSQASVLTTSCASQTIPILEVSTALSGDASSPTCVPFIDSPSQTIFVPEAPDALPTVSADAVEDDAGAPSIPSPVEVDPAIVHCSSLQTDLSSAPGRAFFSSAKKYSKSKKKKSLKVFSPPLASPEAPCSHQCHSGKLFIPAPKSAFLKNKLLSSNSSSSSEDHNLNISRENIPPRRMTLIQCFNCQGFGHLAAHCSAPPLCVKCGLSHPSRTCVKPRHLPASCCHCSGAHTSNYGGCPVVKQYLKNFQATNFCPGPQVSPRFPHPRDLDSELSSRPVVESRPVPPDFPSLVPSSSSSGFAKDLLSMVNINLQVILRLLNESVR